jgi:hypothetical protein
VLDGKRVFTRPRSFWGNARYSAPSPVTGSDTCKLSSSRQRYTASHSTLVHWHRSAYEAHHPDRFASIDHPSNCHMLRPLVVVDHIQDQSDSLRIRHFDVCAKSIGLAVVVVHRENVAWVVSCARRPRELRAA